MLKYLVVGLLAAMILCAVGAEMMAHQRPAAVHSSPLQLPEKIDFSFMVFYPVPPTADPVSTAKTLLSKADPAWTKADAPERDGVYLLDATTRSNFAPPSEDALKYFARGLTPEQQHQLANADRVLAMHFLRKPERNFRCVLSAEQFVDELCRETGGMLWDDSARLAYTADTFKSIVLDSWKDGIPSMRREIAVHAYGHGELVRAVTVGMGKFALPNVAIEQVTRSSSSSATSLIIVATQSMIEAWPTPPASPLNVNLSQIKSIDVRDWVEPTLKAGATSRATVQLVKGTPDEGDSSGPQVAMKFGATPDKVQEDLDATLDGLFGHADSIISVKHDQALLEASARARQKLKTFEPHFATGLLPQERLMVKGPFRENGQTEWMWVEVTKWEGDIIEGILDNDPDFVKSVRAGSRVSVNVNEAFDYIFTHADGSQEGNETGKLLEQRAQP